MEKAGYKLEDLDRYIMYEDWEDFDQNGNKHSDDYYDNLKFFEDCIQQLIDDEYFEEGEYDQQDWGAAMDDNEKLMLEVQAAYLEAYGDAVSDPEQARQLIRNVYERLRPRRSRYSDQEGKPSSSRPNLAIRKPKQQEAQLYSEPTRFARVKAMEEISTNFPDLLRHFSKDLGNIINGKPTSNVLPRMVTYRQKEYTTLNELMAAAIVHLGTITVKTGVTPEEKRQHHDPIDETMFTAPNGHMYTTDNGEIRQITEVPTPKKKIEPFRRVDPPREEAKRIVSAKQCIKSIWDNGVGHARRNQTLSSLFEATRTARCDVCLGPGRENVFYSGYGMVCRRCVRRYKSCAKCSLEAFRKKRNFYKISTWTLPVVWVTESEATQDHSLFCQSVRLHDWVDGTCFRCLDQCQQGAPICPDCDPEVNPLYYNWRCPTCSELWEGYRIFCDDTEHVFTVCSDLCLHPQQHSKPGWTKSTAKDSGERYSKILTAKRYFPLCKKEGCTGEKCTNRHQPLLQSEYYDLVDIFTKNQVNRELPCHREIYNELVNWQKSNEIQINRTTITQEAEQVCPLTRDKAEKEVHLNKLCQEKEDLEKRYKEIMHDVLRLEKDLGKPTSAGVCFNCGRNPGRPAVEIQIPEENTSKTVRIQVPTGNPPQDVLPTQEKSKRKRNKKKGDVPMVPIGNMKPESLEVNQQEAVLRTDPPQVIDRAQVIINHGNDDENYHVQGNIVQVDVRNTNPGEAKILIRILTISHFKTEEQPMMDILDTEKLSITFQQDHPLYGAVLEDACVTSDPTNDTIAHVWVLYKIPIADDQIINLTNKLNMCKLIAGRWNRDPKQIQNARVRVVTLGTHSLTRNVTTGVISHIEDYNDGQFFGIDHTASTYDPDTNQGPGSSGSIVYVQTSQSSWKPLGLHFGICKNKTNTCYNIPEQIPAMPKQVVKWF